MTPIMESVLPFRRLAFPVLLLAAAGPLRAQSVDTIHLIDGSRITGARVISWNVKELRYRRGSEEKILDGERVLDVELNQSLVRGMLKSARRAVTEEDWATAYEKFMEAGNKAQARKKLKDFLPQFAYWRAFEVARDHGTPEDRKEAISELLKAAPDSFYLPRIWSDRIRDAYRRAGQSREGLERVKGVVAAWKAEVEKLELPSRFQIDAELETVLIRQRLREIPAPEVQKKLESLLTRCEGAYPGLANRMKLELANATLLGGDTAKAREMYDAILESGVADQATLAGAYLGRGHSRFRAKDRKPEDARLALLDYMRVAVLFPDIDDELVGEALYYAERAYRAWTPTPPIIALRRLRTALKTKYAESSWAKK